MTEVNQEKPMNTGQICIPHQNYKSFALNSTEVRGHLCEICTDKQRLVYNNPFASWRCKL